MSRITPYNYEKYSIFDIQEHIQKMGFDIRIEFDEGLNGYKLQIVGSNISVDFPKYPEIGLSLGIMPSIRFEDYPRQTNYEDEKKLYERLGRKFHIRKGEKPRQMKDWELMQETIKRLRDL